MKYMNWKYMGNDWVGNKYRMNKDRTKTLTLGVQKSSNITIKTG